MVAGGGHAWLQGGMHGFGGGECCCGGCAWLGACMVAGGMCGCWGACMVAGGHAWLWGEVCMVVGGGVHGCGVVHGCMGVCMVAGGAWLRGACVVAGGVHRIRGDTVNERAVRILLECILVSTYFLPCERTFPFHSFVWCYI